ncbi:hypothetical protein BKA80DRAFT_123963 [Phyllosticta citrichinensis]
MANGWTRDMVGQAGRQVMACMHAPREGLKELWLGANKKSKEVEGEAHGLAWLRFALEPLDCLPDRRWEEVGECDGAWNEVGSGSIRHSEELLGHGGSCLLPSRIAYVLSPVDQLLRPSTHLTTCLPSFLVLTCAHSQTSPKDGNPDTRQQNNNNACTALQCTKKASPSCKPRRRS